MLDRRPAADIRRGQCPPFDRGGADRGRRRARIERRLCRSRPVAGPIGARQCQRRSNSCKRFSLAGRATGRACARPRCGRRAGQAGQDVLPGARRRYFTDRARRHEASSTQRHDCPPTSTASTSATDLTYRQALSRVRRRPRPASSTLGLIGTGHFGDVRVRGSTDFDVSPTARFRSAESRLIGRRPTVDWEGGWPTTRLHTGRARGSPTSAASTRMALALTGEAATDGSVAFGVNLNFSLDPRHGLICRAGRSPRPGGPRDRLSRPQRQRRARSSEPLEKGALVTTGTRQAERPTDANGVGHCRRAHRLMPIAVGVDQTSLADPMLVPKKALQVVVPRPGVPAEVANRPGRRRRHRGRAGQERRARLRRPRSRAGRRVRARSLRPREAISTASSCSSASPTAATRCG